ncbi:putative oligosaccharyltransferase subunit ribophorin II [Talaromyces proteolyticus]|uniref:Oligosaccharyltransferase subunit ribophorin II n=1 Tax=Talaromyces proteolyticus TaxID=1131652 RepID=A0AAD4KSN9_9EURO|nr:putative oligosaccharyltransferase subunit ribophorin II [Talaromyces proteolyticus]KAH8700197.1 putative oligosaccharyltransferase subunit ribophorin II [Talaromyces proteolyticus]
MRWLQCAVQLGLLAAAAPSVYAASWGFTDATVSVNSKSATGNVKESLKENTPLSKPIALSGPDSLKLLLTAQEGRSAKRPHQAFLLLKDTANGLDVSYPLTVKDSGKSKVELTQKDLPVQFLSSPHPVDAEIVIGSFGASDPYRKLAFQLSLGNEGQPAAKSDEVERYRKLPEIHHIFKDDPKSPNIIITLVFLLATLLAVPVLAATWFFLDANLNHLPTALRAAPVPHMVFVGSVVGLEGIFFLYYTAWNLFQTLPAALIVGAIAYVSGSRALGEVQARRLAGQR